MSLLNDTEAEVRSAGSLCLAKVAGIAGEELFLSSIVGKMPELADDSVMDVRQKLAESVMQLLDSDSVNKLSESVIVENIVPILSRLLEDEFSEVQLNVLRKLPIISHLFPKCDKIVECVSKMAEDR